MKTNRTKDTEFGKTAQLLQSIFGSTRYAVAKVHTDGGVSYSPSVGKLDLEQLTAHLKGEKVLGSYALGEADTVNWLGWDVDSNDLKVAKEYAQKIISHLDNIPHAVEFSGGKGYHILIFLKDPMPASRAKQIAEYIRDREGLPRSGKSHVECYPKQSKLTQSNPLGNLLKVPLGIHPRTNTWSIFVDPYNGWESGKSVNPIEVLSRKVTSDQVESILEEEKVDAYSAIANALLPSWGVGERHALALNLAGYLANVGWGMSQVTDLVEMICDKAGDEDVVNRIQAVEDTFKKIQQGKQVAGYTYLADTLPGGVMQVIIEMARHVATPPIMKKLESIRLAKSPNFIKVRDSADIIWTHLNESGIVMKTRTGQLYWYDVDTHLILNMQFEVWLAHIHKHYGINPAEAYGKQVLRSLELRAISDGTITEVHTRSYWDGTKLFVNLGGPMVYILDGEEIEEGYNGECGVIFTTYTDQRNVPIPTYQTDVSAWEFLTDDLSFARSEDVTARPEEQRELLKAWILSFFFPQLMETKPILCALGAPGSGKTSTMRRLVRILEGPKEDVITLSEDKPDSVRASIENHKLLVLDNLESTKATWLINMLNTLSTGSTIELRTLFKTNEVYRIEPNVYVAITAVDIPFSESTLHSRLLPIELAPVADIIPESVIQRKIRQNQEIIWGNLLIQLNDCVAEILVTTLVKAPVQSRLADFTVFCARIAGSGVVAVDPLEKGLMNLVDRQRSQMIQSSPVIEILEDYIQSYPDEAVEWHTYGVLVEKLVNIASKRKIWMDRITTAAALKRHLQPRLPTLQKMFGLETKQVTDKRGRKVELIKFSDSYRIDLGVKVKKEKL